MWEPDEKAKSDATQPAMLDCRSPGTPRDDGHTNLVSEASHHPEVFAGKTIRQPDGVYERRRFQSVLSAVAS